MTTPADQRYFAFSGFYLDTVERRLLGSDGEPVSLSSRAFDVLHYLLEHCGEIVDKGALMAAVWPNTIVEENNLNQAVAALRRVLGETKDQHRFILTIPGRGYQFMPPVRRLGTITPTTVPGGASAAPVAVKVAANYRTIGIALGLLAAVLAAFLIYGRYLQDSSREPVERQAGAPPRETAIVQPVTAGRLPHSVAVLPFENLSPDPADAYFATGLHEEVLNQLAKIRALNVIARTTMRQYKNTPKPLRQVADELNVETVMEGNVRYADNRVRVTAQLIDPDTGVHLWSETYEHEFKNIFAIESDIAMNVANALQAEFSLAEQEAIEQVPSISPEAYELYLSARTYDRQGTGEAVTLGLERIDRALALAPEFAPGWTLKAWLHVYGAGRTGVAAEHYEGVVRAARRALALDPNQADAHAALTLQMTYTGDWLQAAVEDYHAVASGLGGVPDFSFVTGHIQEAHNRAMHYLQKDPLYTVVYGFRFALTDILGDTEAALRLYERGATLFAEWPAYGHFQAMVILLGRGEGERAKALMRTYQSDFPIVREVLERFDTPPAALVKLRTLHADPAYADPNSQSAIAAYAAYFHDPQLALRAMRKATDIAKGHARQFWMPLFREVRQMDEFKAYMREIGLVEYWRQYGWPDLCRPVGADDFECK